VRPAAGSRSTSTPRAGESRVESSDGDVGEYEKWRKKTLGDAATRPHRITYRKLTR